MEKLLADINELVENWDVWTIVATDPAKKEVVIHRTDEDQATIRVQIQGNYPQGTIRLAMLPEEMYPSHTFQGESKRVQDALDDALMQWVELEGMTGHGSYEMEMATHGGNDATANALEEIIPQADFNACLEQFKRDTADPKLVGCVAGGWDPQRSYFWVRIGVPLSTMEGFRARALGLNKKMLIVAELQWTWSYMKDAGGDMPKVVDVYMCDPAVLNVAGDISDTKLPVGSLRWFIMNRIGIALKKNHIVRERKLLGITDDASSGRYVEGLSDWHFTQGEDFSEGGNSNILFGIQRLIKFRVDTCTKNCLICDDLLPLDGMKTSVCDKALCRHGLENYGLGTDVASELAHGEVTELMIYLTFAAAHIGRSRDAFNPMCPIMLPDIPGYKGPTHFYATKYGSEAKNFELLLGTCQKIPSISTLQRMADGKSETLRKSLNGIDPLIFPFLQWILSSNRTHLEPVDPRFHIKGMGKYQFHLVSSSPEKEMLFRNKRAVAASKGLGKNKKGSFWCWHGSQPGNWHCILRSGLKNYSNTKMMSAGAAYGPGIYTAKNIGTSLGYMGQPGGAWKGAEYLPHKNGMTLIALCEIADDKSGYKDHGNNIVTIQDEDIICTRFLFAFLDNQNMPDSSLHTDSMEIPEGALTVS
jgi:hypothetical protein